MKKFLLVLLCFILLFVTIPVDYASSDIPSTWSEEAITALKVSQEFDEAIFSNYKNNITRLEFIYIAVRIYELMDGQEIIVDKSISFTDTEDVYALKGATVGLTSGIGNGAFGVSDFLTREQLATFMVRIMTLLELEMNSSASEKFADDSAISEWAKSSIYLGKNNCIISVVGENKVNPKGFASKEMALLIGQRILQKASSEKTGRYLLSESSNGMTIWTDYPSEHIFKEDQPPSNTASGIDLYLAKNEFEPFQIILNPSESKSISANIEKIPEGFDVEMHQVEYVFLENKTDNLGKTGWYPDPLYPVEMNTEIALKANENAPFWFTVKTDKTVRSGDYTLELQINELKIPLRVHVFDFEIPDVLHVKSQINLSTQSILEKYGVSGTSEHYWRYVDYVKQFMIDHRLTPKSALWSGGLTSSGGAPYIDYDSSTGLLSDPHGIWGFEYPAGRYLRGDENVLNPYLNSDAFNNGRGFPSFMAMTFRNNDASLDQRPYSFDGVKRQSSDWYQGNNLDSPYNKKWFAYISDLESYLKEKDYLDKAYYYMANEPQNQEDYDAISWYAQALKKSAPDLKLMVSEEAKAEIYDNKLYPDAKIDQWLAVLNKYNPDVSWEREANHDEETWIYFLHGTKPPYFNPITLDHPGIESKLTGWFLWKYRIKGIAHYSFNNWQNNVWQEQMTSQHNGDNFMLYPPSRENRVIPYGETNHRLVTSIRLELMRDSLEDYEYLYVLNANSQPIVYESNEADREVDKIIYGLMSYNRDSAYMYRLRQSIGLKISGLIDEIPEIEAADSHQRTKEKDAAYYINFQEPDGKPLASPLVLDGKNYLKIGWNPYDSALGYGWYGDMSHVMYRYIDQEANPLKASILYDDWGRQKVFEFDLPNGEYDVTVCCGWLGKTYSHNQIVIEGIPFITDEKTQDYLERSHRISVSDHKLTMEMGIFDEYTMLNYLEIEPIDK